MSYVIMHISADGRVKALQSMFPEIPSGLVGPGEVAFVVESVGFYGRHNHETLENVEISND